MLTAQIYTSPIRNASSPSFVHTLPSLYSPSPNPSLFITALNHDPHRSNFRCRSPLPASSVSFNLTSRFPVRAALPPLPTIAVISLIASSPVLPAAIINSPFSFLLAALLTNLGLLSSDPLVYAPITDLAPYAVVLLLLSPVPTLPNPTRRSPLLRLLYAFLLAALATFLAVLIASFILIILPISIPPQFPQLAAAFTATYIGGSLNFLAVAHALNLSSQLSATAIAADLVAMAIYIATLFFLAHRISSKSPPAQPIHKPNHRHIERKPLTRFMTSFLTLPIPIASAFALVSLSNIIVHMIRLPSTTSLVLASFLAALLSRISSIQPLFSSTPVAATYALNLFFASLGASAHLPTIMSTSPLIFMYALIILSLHAAFLYSIGYRLLHIDTPLLLIASNANIGGATTAPAYAAACGWHNYVTPAIITATLGYFLATPVAFGVHRLLSCLAKM